MSIDTTDTSGPAVPKIDVLGMRVLTAVIRLSKADYRKGPCAKHELHNA